MSDMSVGSQSCNPNYLPSCTYHGPEPSAPMSGAQLVEEFLDLARQFGEDGVITAAEARILRQLGEYMKEQIAADPDMPPGMKDDLTAFIDGQMDKADAAVPCGAGEGLDHSPCGEALDTWMKLFSEGLEIAREQGLCGQQALDFAMDYAKEGMEHAYPPGHDDGAPPTDGAPGCGGDHGGGRGDYASLYAEGLEVARSEGLTGQDARDRAEEYAQEAMNEGRTTRGGTGGSGGTEGGGGSGGAGGAEGGGGSGGAGGAGGGGDEGVDLVESFLKSSAKQHEENEDAQRGGGGTGRGGSAGGGSGNWLIALAKGMAEIQDKFLTAAMDAMETMKKTAGYEELEGQAKTDMKTEFLDAQATYQASIQMFTMMANITATSIKSIGEGCNSVLRKQ